ncbi:MAG: ATP-dependent helicase, partial [Leifsonia flava]
AQQQGGGGRSQGANAQRKRANRDERTGGTDAAARPRRDRSGRPAEQGSGAGRSRSSEQGQGRSRSGAATGGSGRSGGTGGSGAGRSGSGRSGGLTVGSVVRSNSQGRGPRRAQG